MFLFLSIIISKKQNMEQTDKQEVITFFLISLDYYFLSLYSNTNHNTLKRTKTTNEQIK